MELFGRTYDTKERFISYWHQIDEALKTNPTTVLEVGMGNGFVSAYLRNRGIEVTTVDVSTTWRPKVKASVLNLPFGNSQFDVCLCCEVLEHLPFLDFEYALKQIREVSSCAVLSLPDASWYVGLEIQTPICETKPGLISVPKVFSTKRKKEQPSSTSNEEFHVKHYWEIGKRGYEMPKVMKAISSSGLSVERTFRVFESPFHRFLILRRIPLK